MGKPRKKYMKSEGGGGAPEKRSLERAKKPSSSSISRKRKKGPSPGPSRVTRARQELESYTNLLMPDRSAGIIVRIRDSGNDNANQSTVPVKLENWTDVEAVVKEEHGDGVEPSDDHKGSIIDFPPAVKFKVEVMSDSVTPEMVPDTEEATDDITMDDYSQEEREHNNRTPMGMEEDITTENIPQAAPVSGVALHFMAEALPHVFKDLTDKELLLCRVVCKNWCRKVDYFLENHPIYYPYRHDITNERILRSVRGADLSSSSNLPFTRFPTVESLTDFLKEFENSPRNHFVGKYVSLEPNYFLLPHYWEVAKEMGSQLGTSIWKLKIYTCVEKNVLEFCKEVCEFLKLVPKLKYLEFDLKINYALHMTPQMEHELFSFLIQNPFPTLSQLQTLVLPNRYSKDVISKLFVDRYGGQVGKSILLNFEKWKPKFPCGASSLTELRIGMKNATFKSFAHNVLTPMLAVNLQKFELEWKTSPSFIHDSMQYNIPVNQLFKELQQFTLLKAVSISFLPFCVEKWLTCTGCVYCAFMLPVSLTCKSAKAPLPILMPSVEFFKLATTSPFLTFQFLKSLPQLKCFDLRCEVGHLLGIKEDEDDIGMELKNLVYGDSSQLWKLLPSLKQVKLNGREYNRPLEFKKSDNPWIRDFNKILPNLFCKFENTAWLKLRLVCPTWKRVVENFVDNHPARRPTFKLESLKQVKLTRLGEMDKQANFPCLVFQTPEKLFVRKKVALENKSESNPFWVRSILFAPDEHLDELFWNAAEDFLKTFGHHVWFLSLDHNYNSRESTEDELFLYKNVQRCLKNLPNLKSLQLRYAVKFEMESSETNVGTIKFMKENPLPSMEHLDTLRITAVNLGARKTVNALYLKYSGQLKRLDIVPENWSYKFNNLPKLVHLYVKIFAYTQLPTLFWSLKLPNLQHLHVEFLRNMDQQLVFMLLKPFKVRCLSINFNNTYFTNETLINPLDANRQLHVDMRITQFPSVEHLFVGFYEGSRSLQFLRCFPSLKYLHFQRYEREESCDDVVWLELMKCRNGIEAVRHSKIWTIFPQLQEMEIQIRRRHDEVTIVSTFVNRPGYFYTQHLDEALLDEDSMLLLSAELGGN